MDNSHSINNIDTLSDLKGFKVVHLNVRSLYKKIDQLRLLMQDTEIDIFTVSETWLKEHLNSQLYAIEDTAPNHPLFERQDRCSFFPVLCYFRYFVRE